LEKPLWDRTEYEIKTFLSLSGSHQWWQRDRPRFSPEFAEYVDSLLAQGRQADEIPTIGNIKAAESDT
ncbi:MAG: hypothetical protein ACU84Q_21785, partial [Gammaproteobacteria bacterium]